MLTEEKIYSKLNQAYRILLIAHRKPDGDTLGALGALFFYLKDTLNKKVTAFCVDPIPSNLEFLSDNLILENDIRAIKLETFDLIIALDCGDLNRTGITKELKNLESKPFLINLDHHHANDHYGDENLIKPQSSSTSEIIYDFFKKFKLPLTKNIRNLLLTGIVTDTNFFSNAATTNAAVLAASELLNHGADLKKITRQLNHHKNVQVLKLWGGIFNRLLFNKEAQIAIAVITREDLNQYSKIAETLDGLSDFLTNLYDAKIVLILTQTTDFQIKGSLRTTDDDLDVSALAQKFGGGGHKKAAGFTLNGRLQFINGFWRIG